jgi:hypothetical protein
VSSKQRENFGSITKTTSFKLFNLFFVELSFVRALKANTKAKLSRLKDRDEKYADKKTTSKQNSFFSVEIFCKLFYDVMR